MNSKNIIIKEIENLPEPMLAEVLDFVRFLEQKKLDKLDTYILSESSLEKDWLSPVEDEAWKNL
ncbi:MAG: DUF2281 domain-containing protein [Spirochaetota bacterium]